ncbi:YceI family protein [Streptomyces sp. MP131-18]|uniref:YceI family protein n=1 Tax=Streptomyces sp. MP131-18 TaxID=1857892 RepID=UPI00097BE956|nr:YceI family protein [Streptomyces sp. MP131-18]ONK09831.1 hypothetical protein STBA_05350 [Streptomyces sp. MP131-18]
MDAKPDHATTTPRPGRYLIDPDRSAVTFTMKSVFGLAPVRGSFAIGSGTADVAEPLGESRAHAVIEAGSFRTGSAKRDEHVRSPRFLDTEAHPLITFVSGHGDRADPAVLAGTLTVRGVERPVELTIERAQVSAGEFTVRATASVDRVAFGVSASRGMTGRHLGVTLDVTFVRS